MILFPHMLAGALIGAKTQNWGLVFVLAIIFHFLLDSLPHWDYLKESLEDFERKKFPYFLLKVAVDLALGAIVIGLFFDFSGGWLKIAGGAFISILPDGFTFINLLTKRKIGLLEDSFRLHNIFHDKLNHKIYSFIFKKESTPVRTGLIIEFLVILCLIFLILTW